MLKDYYRILGVPQTASAEEIKKAYRALVLKWHPDAHPESDTTEHIKEINEAYLILSDSGSRARYDKEYRFFRYANPKSEHITDASRSDDDYEIHDEELRHDIAKAKKAAEEYVRELFASLRNDSLSAAKGAWAAAKPWLVAAFIMTAISFIALGVLSNTKLSHIDNVSEMPSLSMVESLPSVPVDWKTYNGEGAFELSVPPTVELRNEEDAYSSLLRSLNLTQNEGIVVFQQKGLSNQEAIANGRYCRIMIQYIRGDRGDFMTTTETEAFDYEWKSVFDDMVKENIGPYAKLIGDYTYKWRTINGARCIQIDYRRTGSNFDSSIPVVVRLALFQNDDRMVRIALSYREKDHELWKEDFEMVLNSFKWL